MEYTLEVPSHLDLDISEINKNSELTIVIIACYSQSEGTPKTILNAMLSMVSELPVKTSRTLNK